MWDIFCLWEFLKLLPKIYLAMKFVASEVISFEFLVPNVVSYPWETFLSTQFGQWYLTSQWQIHSGKTFVRWKAVFWHCEICRWFFRNSLLAYLCNNRTSLKHFALLQPWAARRLETFPSFRPRNKKLSSKKIEMKKYMFMKRFQGTNFQ